MLSKIKTSGDGFVTQSSNLARSSTSLGGRLRPTALCVAFQVPTGPVGDWRSTRAPDASLVQVCKLLVDIFNLPSISWVLPDMLTIIRRVEFVKFEDGTKIFVGGV